MNFITALIYLCVVLNLIMGNVPPSLWHQIIAIPTLGREIWLSKQHRFIPMAVEWKKTKTSYDNSFFCGNFAFPKQLVYQQLNHLNWPHLNDLLKDSHISNSTYVHRTVRDRCMLQITGLSPSYAVGHSGWLGKSGSKFWELSQISWFELDAYSRKNTFYGSNHKNMIRYPQCSVTGR